MKSKKIVVIGHRPPPVTGENLCLQHLESELRKCRYEVVSKTRSSISNLLLFKTSIWLIPGAKSIGHLRDAILLAWWRLIGCEVDIYVHNISWTYFVRGAWFWRLIAGSKMRFVVLTDKIATSLTGCGLRVKRLDNTLTQGSEPMELGPFDPHRLVWMSALTVDKGFDVACRIYEVLRTRDPRWQFDVYGDGPARSFLDDCLGAHFNGFIQGVEKDAALKKGGIMLLPSRYRHETQPLVLIEALAYGLPVVASDVGGIAVMIGEGPRAAGVCLPAQAPVHEWVTAVQTAHDQYARFSNEARRQYMAVFSRQVFRRKLLDLLEGAVV